MVVGLVSEWLSLRSAALTVFAMGITCAIWLIFVVPETLHTDPSREHPSHMHGTKQTQSQSSHAYTRAHETNDYEDDIDAIMFSDAFILSSDDGEDDEDEGISPSPVAKRPSS